MDDLSRVRFDQTAATAPRAASLSRVKMVGAGRWHAPLGGRPAARFMAVRGVVGAGKSTVAANLAIALAGLRSRVVLIDLDRRNPTQHELFGIAAPVHGLKALLHEQIDTMEQALTATAVRNLYLVSAEGTAPDARPANVEQQHRLLGQLWELDADVVIADVGPDPSDDLVNLFELGALRLFVAAPDPTSILRAYGFFSEQVVREIEHVAGGTTEGDALIAALGAPHPRPMAELLARAASRPNIRAALEQTLAAFAGRLVGNHLRGTEEADMLHAASRLIGEYLGIAVPVLGVVESSTQLDATRLTGRPLLLGAGIDRNVRLFHSMAEQLLMDCADSEAARCVARPRIAVDDVDRGTTRALADVVKAPAPELPTSLQSYMRRHPRHPVDWLAVYRSDAGRETPVRIFELSLSGASIETLPGLDVGERGSLVFSQIAGQPAVPVSVMDTRRPLGRAGLRFDGAPSICDKLAKLAASVRSR